MTAFYDENTIRHTIQTIMQEGQLFEVRIIRDSKTNFSGYFRDVDTLLEKLKRMDLSGCNVYMTINTINPACYDRSQRNKFERGAKNATGDDDIDGFNYLMIDLDPKRPAGTSSTDEQVKKAKDLGNEIFAFMRNIGFNSPLACNSGNGMHLLYRVQLKNTDSNVQLMKKALQTLDMLFSNEDIEIDVKTYNASRVCKLYGTLAQKGISSEERPHRMSYIISEGNGIPTDRKYIEKLCELFPKEEKPQRYNNYHPKEFDLENWLNEHSIRYRRGGYSDGVKYILDCCPFNSNHKGKDACVFQSKNGAIGFHCFHNSCADKTWRDVRILYEPDAYERRNQEYHQQIYAKNPPRQTINANTNVGVKTIEAVEGHPVFYTANDILNMPNLEETFIKSGIREIDKKMRGLKKGYVSVMSGLRASGKSSIISEMCLDCVQTGNNVGVFSGELAPKNFMRWMYLQAAGKGWVEPTDFEGYYNVQRKYQQEIASWLGDHFWLYNNEYGNDYLAIIEKFEKHIEEHKLDFLILDNLMAFNISGLSEIKFDAQSEFVLSLQRLAKRRDIHILFVAHPRKAMGFLRLDDISGTGDLGNAVDNAFIVHRVNNDFKRLTKQMFGWKEENPLYEATNVIEIAKDRDGGNMDNFIPLYYEKETKRLKNDEAENKIYGWNHDVINEKYYAQNNAKPEPEPVPDGFIQTTEGEVNFL